MFRTQCSECMHLMSVHEVFKINCEVQTLTIANVTHYNNNQIELAILKRSVKL